MDKNFLLENDTAKKLYEYAKNLPIVDYHNHLNVADIVNNIRFTDVYELWVKPDPYKHRMMRMCGVEERYITGEATNEEKFEKWWETLPKLVGNHMYHWSVMELEVVFGITDAPESLTARQVFEKCNAYLAENKVTALSLLAKFGVEYASPCASLCEDISSFSVMKSFAPSLRGDDIVAPTADFVKRLGDVVHENINNLNDFKCAVAKRLDDFYAVGCRFADHAIDNGFCYYTDDGKNGERFESLMEGELSENDRSALSSHILTFLGGEYAKRGLVMQLHIGAQRFTSTKLRKAAGATGGFAGIGNSVDVNSLTVFLDTLDCAENGLSKTVLFTLNPSDNALISVLSGSYAKDGVCGLVSQGPAWWWCDHKKGITDMLKDMWSFGLAYNFIGMTTDSRSFLSFVRHDYFRRILCSFLGKKAEVGELMCGEQTLQELLYRMCYANALD